MFLLVQGRIIEEIVGQYKTLILLFLFYFSQSRRDQTIYIFEVTIFNLHYQFQSGSGSFSSEGRSHRLPSQSSKLREGRFGQLN